MSLKSWEAMVVSNRPKFYVPDDAFGVFSVDVSCPDCTWYPCWQLQDENRTKGWWISLLPLWLVPRRITLTTRSQIWHT